MSQLILTAHTGIHDAGAALFEDYNLLAAVQLERLTRFKCDGRDHPDLAIDEVLSIAGKTRQDVDVAGFSCCELARLRGSYNGRTHAISVSPAACSPTSN
jgi:predicted NodU family carbamoyl transferase